MHQSKQTESPFLELKLATPFFFALHCFARQAASASSVMDTLVKVQETPLEHLHSLGQWEKEEFISVPLRQNFAQAFACQCLESLPQHPVSLSSLKVQAACHHPFPTLSSYTEHSAECVALSPSLGALARAISS